MLVLIRVPVDSYSPLKPAQDLRLALQLGDEVSFGHIPAYQRIRKQQRLVEEAIEHMAVKHCADLNSSVAAVGRMSRQFDEAKMRVRTLRCV